MAHVSKDIRRARVAGMFYPAGARELTDSVNRMLASTGRGPGSSAIRSVVSPHAGYPYSGQTAAHGFARLNPPEVSTVVIIGPSHVEYFPFTSVYGGAACETPTGKVPINHDLVKEIVACSESIRISDHGHYQPDLARGEHGIEVQLPFLQQVVPDATIVPIVMGDQSWDRCVELGNALAKTCSEPGVIYLASSDLSHFYSQARATELDSRLCAVLAQGDPGKFFEAISSGACEACGAGPIIATLIANGAEPGIEFELLHRITSGDITGDHSSVVGYASALFTSNQE